jgi:hypothetical protein
MMVNILKKELRLQATKPNASKKQMETYGELTLWNELYSFTKPIQTLWKRECILFNRAIEAFG